MGCRSMTKPDCYKCYHRREVLGDTHSSCAHPIVQKTPRGELLALLKGRVGANLASGADALGIRGNAHGIRCGWFNWPYNFDPTWLETCNGFTPKEGSLK